MKILRFVDKVFFTGLTILSNFTRINSLSCISMSNQPCKARPEIVNVNSSGNCNNINDPCARICVPDIVKIFTITSFTINIFIFSIIANAMQNKLY